MEDLVDFLGRHQMPLPGAGRATAPKVLIVDDSPADVKLASKALQLMDCDLEVARDGFSAGAALGSFQPDLVTLDLRMPGLSGFEVIKLMRGTPAYKGIKILVVSSMPTEELERAREAGADDVLQKPVDYKTLQEKVTTLLGTALSGKANRQNLERMG
jgi:CheY-like chemotaxis protein